MRHFDAHAYRTEDEAGVWEFAGGCMRTYLILKEKARALRRPTRTSRRRWPWRRSTSSACRRCPSRRRPLREAARGDVRRRRARDVRLRPRAARPARDRAPPRRAVACSSRGVDSSTQSTKVEVRDADTGALVGSGRAPHPPTPPPCSEQDPQTWWDALGTSARRAAGHADEIVATVRSRAQQHGLVVTDATGRPLRPAKLWNDTESARRRGLAARPARRRRGRRGPTRAARSRSPRSRSRKLSWLHRTEPETFARIERVMLPHDWLAWRLTGELGTDRGDASGTGYWSPRPGEYRLDLLEIVDRELDWARGAPAGARPAELAMGTGDNMAAALGLGLRARRRRDLARDLGHGVRGERHADRRSDRRGRRVRRRDRSFPPARLHAERHQGDGHRRPTGSDVDLAGLDALALAARRRAPAASRCVPVLRRRAHAEPPRRDGLAHRADARRRRARTSPARRVRRGRVRRCSTGSTRSPRPGVADRRPAVRGRAAARGAPPTAGPRRPRAASGDRGRRPRAGRARRVRAGRGAGHGSTRSPRSRPRGASAAGPRSSPTRPPTTSR